MKTRIPPAPPAPLPKSPASALAPGSEMLAATAVSAVLKPDGFLLLTYVLDDGAHKTVRLPADRPPPRPGQTVLIFFQTGEAVRFTTLPFRSIQ